MKNKIPNFQTDQEAEEFVGNADLSEYDLSNAKPVRFTVIVLDETYFPQNVRRNGRLKCWRKPPTSRPPQDKRDDGG